MFLTMFKQMFRTFMDSFGKELVIALLAETNSSDNHELCAMRLQILGENALAHLDIPLEAVDMINNAIHLL